MTPNTELFRRVHESIEKHPFRFVMNTWSDTGAVPGGDVYDWRTGEYTVAGEGECGTTYCVAGWALYHHDPAANIADTAREIVGGDVCGEAGAELLGLDGRRARKLFTTDEETADWIVRLFAAGSNDAAFAAIDDIDEGF